MGSKVKNRVILQTLVAVEHMHVVHGIQEVQDAASIKVLQNVYINGKSLIISKNTYNLDTSTLLII